MNDNFYIASRLSKIRMTEQEAERVREKLEMMREDEKCQIDFFNWCRQWKMAPWIFTRVLREGLSGYIAPAVLEEFRKMHERIEEQNKNRNAEAVKFLRAFRDAGIDVCILKGNLFAHSFYRDIGYKRMNDFDILIHPRDWVKAQEIYAKLNYIPMGFGWSGEKQAPASFSHTGIPYISRNFQCIIGTQWGLKSPTTHYKVDLDEAWATARDFDLFGVTVKQLSPEYNLLHLILHMGVFKCGLRDCMDVYNLLLHEKMDENKVVRLLEKTDAVDKAFFTLQLANYCSESVPQSLLSRLQPSGFLAKRSRLRERAIEESSDFHISYNDYFQDIEKNVLYFNIVHKFHQKLVFYLRILRQIYFPARETALQLIDKKHKPTFWNRVRSFFVAPYLVFALIAQEIGWKFTILLFIKLFFDVIISLINYIIPRESYFAWLKKQNIDPKEIQRAVSNVQ